MKMGKICKENIVKRGKMCRRREDMSIVKSGFRKRDKVKDKEFKEKVRRGFE